MKLSVALSLGLVALPELASASFAATCRNWFWQDGHYMVAECKKADQTWRTTRQDMNLCIGRSGNYLVSMNSGNAFMPGTQACVYYSLSGTTLTALCNEHNPVGYNVASIDLNTFVHNSNGFLQCHGHLGAPV